MKKEAMKRVQVKDLAYGQKIIIKKGLYRVVSTQPKNGKILITAETVGTGAKRTDIMTYNPQTYIYLP